MTFKGCPHCDMSQAVDFIKRRTVLLIGKSPHDGKPHVGGTAVLFDVAGTKFLLGAHHVIEVHKRGVPLQIALHDVDSFLLIKGESRVVAAPIDKNDPSRDYDTAIVQLAPEVSDRLTKHGMVFMSRGDVALEEHYHEHSHVAVFGFPEETFDPDTANTKSLPFSGMLYRPSTRKGKYFDSKLHLGIHYDPSHRQNLGEAGQPIQLPEPFGLSGCGMWAIHDKPNKGASWSTGNIKLLGIQHKWIYQTILVGTRIEIVIGGMKKGFPELRSALNLGFPLVK